MVDQVRLLVGGVLGRHETAATRAEEPGVTAVREVCTQPVTKISGDLVGPGQSLDLAQQSKYIANSCGVGRRRTGSTSLARFQSTQVEIRSGVNTPPSSR